MLIVLKYLQIVVALLLIVSILLQAKGTGLDLATMANATAIQTKKRGAEKFLYQTTVFLSVMFVLVSISFVFV